MLDHTRGWLRLLLHCETEAADGTAQGRADMWFWEVSSFLHGFCVVCERREGGGGGWSRIVRALPSVTEKATPQLGRTVWNVERSGTLRGKRSCHFGIYTVEAKAAWVE